ncbi:hypothetical protein VB002_04135 [Campylobacter concisus]
MDEKGVALSVHKTANDIFVIANDKICKNAHISGHYKEKKAGLASLARAFLQNLQTSQQMPM